VSRHHESDFDRELLEDLAKTSFGRAVRDFPIKYFHATLEGGEHLPREGGALLVANHGFFGIDAGVLGMLVVRETGRQPRFLGERNLWKIPGLGGILSSVGALPGEPVAATEILARGELVIVYPGGVDDSFKGKDQKHRLQWGTRAGFARVAMRAGVPIIPVAGLGIDDMYAIVGHEKWLGRRLFGSRRYDFPIALGAFGTLFPRRRKQTYVALSPIDTSGDPENLDDVERVRRATYESLDARLGEVRDTRED
jgi:1-acyl-sn-glycerol-3-phosphate acyltransferase